MRWLIHVYMYIIYMYVYMSKLGPKLDSNGRFPFLLHWGSCLEVICFKFDYSNDAECWFVSILRGSKWGSIAYKNHNRRRAHDCVVRCECITSIFSITFNPWITSDEGIYILPLNIYKCILGFFLQLNSLTSTWFTEAKVGNLLMHI